MANPSIRGHKGQFKIFTNGELENIVDITQVSISQESSFSRTEYIGRSLPEGDQSMQGWSGSIDLEVKDAAVEDFIDALVTNNLNGVGISDYAFLTTEEYGDNTRRSYVYFDCQFKMSRSQGGLSEKITKKIDFQAAGRTLVS